MQVPHHEDAPCCPGQSQPSGPGWGCSAPGRIGSGLPREEAGGGLSPGCPRAPVARSLAARPFPCSIALRTDLKARSLCSHRSPLAQSCRLLRGDGPRRCKAPSPMSPATGDTQEPPTYVHPAPGVDVQHLGVHPEPGAGPGRLQWEQGEGESRRRGGVRLRHSLSASAPRFTRTRGPPAPPSELLAPDSRKATTISIKQSHRVPFPRSLCEKMHLKGPSAGEMLPPRSEGEGRGRRSLLREQRCRQGVIKHTLMNFPARIAVMNPRNVLPSPASLLLRSRSERTTPAHR